MHNQYIVASVSSVKLKESRQSFVKWNNARIRRQKENPIDWNATIKAGKAVFQTK